MPARARPPADRVCLADPSLPTPALGEAGWVGMRTVADLRRALGVGAPRDRDSLYRPIERAPRKFNPLKIPRALQARCVVDALHAPIRVLLDGNCQMTVHELQWH